MNTSFPSPQRNGFVVVGLGKMGIMHASMLGVVPGGKVAALVDLQSTNCEQVRSMGLQAPGFQDLKTCLEQVRPEGVWICTPQFTHRSLMELCLEQEVPVFCEKPLAHTLEDARAMAERARQCPDRPVAVGYMIGHNPLFDQAAEMVRNGVLGQVKSFQANCRLSQVMQPPRKQHWLYDPEKSGGGVLINSGCHLLYSIMMVLGSPTGLLARGTGVHNQVEDTLSVLFDYPSGLWGAVEINWAVPGYETQTNEILLTGTAGTLELNMREMTLWLARKSGPFQAGFTQWHRHELQPSAAFSLSPDYCGDEFFLEDADFVRAVQKGGTPRVGIEQALRVQEQIDAIYRSLNTRRYTELDTTETETAA